MNDSMDFLIWTRGIAFDVSVTLFVIGVVVRLFEILSLGRKNNLASPKGPEFGPGMRTVLSRSVPDLGIFRRQPLTVVTGYMFHIGLLISLVFFVPHIELFRETFGFGWPGLPTPVVDAAAVLALIGLIAALWHRLMNPVMQKISGFEDWLVWILTFLPILTGYLAFHRLVDPYSLMLGLHILSVEALMILFPFTKLMHTFTVFLSRWYNGAMSGRRGVES